MITTATRLMKLADSNAKVSGTYHGVPFTGTAISSRQLNWAPDYPERLTIALDEPITVFGGWSNMVMINSRQVDEGEHALA